MTKSSILLIAVAFWFGACNSAQHEEQKAEHSKNEQPVPKVKIAEIEAGIKAYIKEKTNQQDGFFYVQDEEKELRMKLVRVHTEYLSNLGPKRHFACVDLADVSGDVYDVDFFLSGDPGSMV